jgi:hypothetical protein
MTIRLVRQDDREGDGYVVLRNQRVTLQGAPEIPCVECAVSIEPLGSAVFLIVASGRANKSFNTLKRRGRTN